MLRARIASSFRSSSPSYHFRNLTMSSSASASSLKPGSSPPPPPSSSSSTSTRTETVISNPHADVTTFSRPFSRFGLIPVGGRSTAIVLRNEPNTDHLWVLASTPLDSATRAKISTLGNGQVKYLIAPDYVHHLYISEWSQAFPEAKCIGVDGLQEKRKDIKWAGLYGIDEENNTKYGFEDEIQVRYWPTFSNKDLVFNHKSSGSLIVTDLLFNLPPTEQYSATSKGKPTSPIPFLTSFLRYLAPNTTFHKWFLGSAGTLNPIPKACLEVGKTLKSQGGTAQERKERFAMDAEIVAGWDFGRIIPCHGDVVEGDAKKKWIQTFEKYLTPEGKSRFRS